MHMCVIGTKWMSGVSGLQFKNLLYATVRGFLDIALQFVCFVLFYSYMHFSMTGTVDIFKSHQTVSNSSVCGLNCGTFCGWMCKRSDSSDTPLQLQYGRHTDIQ